MPLSLRNKAFSDWYDELPYGEPSYQETFEAGQHAETFATLQFLSDVVTAAGLLRHGKTDKALAERISADAYKLRTAIVKSNAGDKPPQVGLD